MIKKTDLQIFSDELKIIDQLAKLISAEIFLVGGSVRDWLLNREISDLDFVISADPIQFGKDFAEKIDGSFVKLSDQPPTARVVKSKLIYDFTTFQGDQIRDDLRQRDLTINALAISVFDLLQNDFDLLIDETSGIEDLRAKMIRVIDESVIENDPLRILRVYRLSAQLDFRIADETRQLNRRHAEKLKTIAIERIRDEFFKILSVKFSWWTIALMIEDRVLQTLFPKVESFDLALLKQLEILTDRKVRSEIEIYLETPLISALKIRSALKLIAISDNNSIIKQLQIGKKVRGRLDQIRLGKQILQKNLPTDRSELIKLFRSVKNDWIGGMLMVTGPERIEMEKWIRSTADFYENVFQKTLRQKSLIKVRKLRKKFHIPDRKIGEILRHIQDQQMLGRVRNEIEAWRSAENFIEKNSENFTDR